MLGFGDVDDLDEKMDPRQKCKADIFSLGITIFELVRSAVLLPHLAPYLSSHLISAQVSSTQLISSHHTFNSSHSATSSGHHLLVPRLPHPFFQACESCGHPELMPSNRSLISVGEVRLPTSHFGQDFVEVIRVRPPWAYLIGP